MPRSRLRRDDHRAHVDVQRRVDIVEREVVQRGRAEDARVVDEDVEAAERLRGMIDRAAHGHRIGAVGLDRDGPAAERLDVGNDGPRPLRRFLVSDRDVRAIGRQPFRNGRADAATAARDECALALKSIHESSCGHLCNDRHRMWQVARRCQLNYFIDRYRYRRRNECHG